MDELVHLGSGWYLNMSPITYWFLSYRRGFYFLQRKGLQAKPWMMNPNSRSDLYN